MTRYFILLALIILTFSCKKDKFNDITKRNQNYAWLIPEGRIQGEWVKIENNEFAIPFSNGNFTFFYENGNKNSQSNYNKNGDFDTLFCYGLNENLTHYITYINEDSANIYIYNDGIFEAYDNNNILILTGYSENHQLTSYQFHNYIEQYIRIVKLQKIVREKEIDFFSFLSNFYSQNTNYKSALSKIEIQQLDSLYLTLKVKYKDIKNELNNMDYYAQSQNLLNLTQVYLQELNSTIEVEIPEILKLLHENLDGENYEKGRELAFTTLKREISILSNYSDNIIIDSRNLHLNEFYVYLITLE